MPKQTWGFKSSLGNLFPMVLQRKSCTYISLPNTIHTSFIKFSASDSMVCTNEKEEKNSLIVANELQVRSKHGVSALKCNHANNHPHCLFSSVYVPLTPAVGECFFVRTPPLLHLFKVYFSQSISQFFFPKLTNYSTHTSCPCGGW